MHPILFEFNGLTVYAYGAMLGVGFLLGLARVLTRAPQVGIPSERGIELFCLVLVCSVAGARALHVLTHIGPFKEDPLKVFRVWEGGLVFYGGLILAVPAALVYIRRHGLSAERIFDLFAPSLALGLFFARIGCFLAGCCYGKETSLPWGVMFTHPDSLAPRQVLLHPTQLYEAGAGLALFFYLVKTENRQSLDGRLFWQWLFFYSVFRVMIEFLRGDPRGLIPRTFISTSQAIGFVLAILAYYMLFYWKRRHGGGRKHGRSGGLEIPPSDIEKEV